MGIGSFAVSPPDALTETCEAAVIDAWFDYMNEVRDPVCTGSEPLVSIWSQAEISSLLPPTTQRHKGTGRQGKAGFPPNGSIF